MEKLKCTIGDTAIFTSSHNHNGKIVKIIRPFDELNCKAVNERIYFNGMVWSKEEDKFYWLVECLGTPLEYEIVNSLGMVVDINRITIGPGLDYTLTPLFPDKILDEVIRKADLPIKETL